MWNASNHLLARAGIPELAPCSDSGHLMISGACAFCPSAALGPENDAEEPEGDACSGDRPESSSSSMTLLPCLSPPAPEPSVDVDEPATAGAPSVRALLLDRRGDMTENECTAARRHDRERVHDGATSGRGGEHEAESERTSSQ
jgi:hypothetical protein